MATINLDQWAAPLAGLPVDVQIALWKQLAGRGVDPSTVYQLPFVSGTAAISAGPGASAVGSLRFQTVTCLYGISASEPSVARQACALQITTRNGSYPWLGTSDLPITFAALPDISTGAQSYLRIPPTVALLRETWNFSLTNNATSGSTDAHIYLRGVSLYTPGGGF